MKQQALIADVGIGLIGGYVGTEVMEPVSMTLYELESDEARRQEDAVRPGPPYELAARKITGQLGLKLSDAQIQRLGVSVFHYGLGMSWGPVYVLLRRRTALAPILAGLATGGTSDPHRRRGSDAPFGFQRAQPCLPACHPRAGRSRPPGLRPGRRRRS